MTFPCESRKPRRIRSPSRRWAYLSSDDKRGHIQVHYSLTLRWYQRERRTIEKVGHSRLELGRMTDRAGDYAFVQPSGAMYERNIQSLDFAEILDVPRWCKTLFN